MNKSAYKNILKVFLTMLLILVLTVTKTFAQTDDKKFQFALLIDGKEELTIQEFMDSIEVKEIFDWETFENIYKDVITLEVAVKSLNGEANPLSAFEFELAKPEWVSELNSFTSGVYYRNGVATPALNAWTVNTPNSNLESIVFAQAFNTNASIGENHNVYSDYSIISKIEVSVDKTKIGDGFYLDINYDGITVGDAGYVEGGTTKTYSPNLLKFHSTKVGEPNSTPDASLSALNIKGITTNKSYNFDVNASEVDDEIRQTITLEHQDSISGLTINPIFTKTSLSTSNYTITENKKGENFATGDSIKIVTTDGVETKTYVIDLVVNEASTNTGISVTVAPGDSGEVLFNSTVNRYEIIVPFTETDIKLLATTADPYATLDVSELRSTDLVQGEFKHIGDFNVTAENGTTKANYPIYVKREKGSSNTNIKLVTNEYPTGFDPVGNTFTLDYDQTKTSVSFQILKNHTGQTIRYKEVGVSEFKTYTSGLISKNNLQTGSSYSFEIEVTPESGITSEIQIYTVIINIDQSSNTDLETGNIKVQETGFQALNLNISNLTYTIVNNASSNVRLTIEPGLFREVKIGEGTYQSIQLNYDIDVSNLEFGENIFILTIKAQDGTEKDYTIKIVKKSDQAEVDTIVFRLSDGTIIAHLDDFTFISSENKYTYAFDYGKYPSASSFAIEVATSNKSIIKSNVGNTLLQSLDFSGNGEVTKTISLEVTSENGSVVKHHTIQITRNAADANNEVASISVGGAPFIEFQIGDFDVTYNKIVVEPVGGISTLNFEVVLPAGSKASVTIGTSSFPKTESGRYSTNVSYTRGVEQIVTIIITAQNGDINTLKIPFVVATNDKTLKTLEIENTGFVFDAEVLVQTININYSFSSNIKITASSNHVDSKVFIDGQVRSSDTYIKAIGNGTTTFKVWVVSEAGQKGSEYTINIVRAEPKTHNALETFTLKTQNGQTIDIGFLSSQTSYTLRVDDYDELWPLTYSASVNTNNYSYIGSKGVTSIENQLFNTTSGNNNSILIHVYSEGAIVNTYTIHIKRANDVKAFDSVTISGAGFVTQTFTAEEFISGTLDIGNISYNVDRLNVTFHMIDGSKSAMATDFMGNSLSGTWFFNKTGAIESSFRVVSQAGNYSAYYKLKVNRQEASKENALNNLEVFVDGKNLLLEFSPTTNSYILRVDRDVDSVVINASVLTSDRSSVNSPFNYDKTEGLNQIYQYVYYLNDPAAQASNVIDVVVKAESGISQSYKITIWRRNIEIGIQNIEILNGAKEVYKGPIADVPNLGVFEYQVNQLTFIVTPEDEFSRISFINGTVISAGEDGIVRYTHQLAVGDNQTIQLRIQSDLQSSQYPAEAKSQTYNFTYTRKAASDLAQLEDLKIIVGGINLLDGIFDGSMIRYEGAYLRVDRTHVSVQIQATSSDFGTISGLGIKEIKPGQENSYTITVNSQSGTFSKDYTVYIVSKNDDNDINNIKINSDDIDFMEDTLEYTLENVLYTTSSLPIQVILNDKFAAYYVNGVKNATSAPLVYGDNTIEIYAESEYGTKSTHIYKLHIHRTAPYEDTGITSLTIRDITTNKILSHTTDGFNFLVTLLDQSTISNIKIEIVLKNDTIQTIETTSNLSNINLIYNSEGGLDQTVSFKIKAENNSAQNYQVRFIKNVVLSSDNSLNNVTIKNQDNQIIPLTIQDLILNNELTIALPYSHKSLNIDITPNHSKANVTPSKMNTVILNVGENIFEFSITAEDGTQSDPYTLIINRGSASKNVSLNDLTITDPNQEGLFLLGLENLSTKGMIFNPSTRTYTFKLDASYINEEVIINLSKENSAQTISGPVNAPLTLNHGVNRYEIFVKAEDESVTQGKYTIIIEVKYESNSIKTISVDGQSMTIEDTMLFDTEKESVSITPVLEYPNFGRYEIKNDLGVVVSNNPSLTYDKNIFTIDIINEYGVVIKTHTLEITRHKSSENTISNISLIGSDAINYLTTFNLNIDTYNIEVPQNVSYVTLNGNVPEKATTVGFGKHIIELDQTITITFKVIAEDGSATDEYVINVTRRALSTNNKLQEINIVDTLDPTSFLLGLKTKNPDVIFDKDTNNYMINLGLEYLDINYKNLAIRYVTGDIYQTVDKAPLSTLSLVKGANIFVVTVLAEDQLNTQPFIYTITINVLNKENDLKSLKVNNENIDITGNQIHYQTEAEQANITYTPTFNDGQVILKNADGQIISNLVDLALGENTVMIEVLNAYDEIVETYELIITRNASSDYSFDATLTDKALKDYLSFEETKDTYHIEVPYDIDEVSLQLNVNPKATSTGEGNFKLISGHTKEITFQVIAENGEKSLVYQVFVTRMLNTEDKLTSLFVTTNTSTLISTTNFDPELSHYIFEVDETHTDITFNYTTHYGQTVSGVELNTPMELKHGLNTFNIFIQPEDTSVNPFEITIEVKVINAQIDLKQLLVNGEDVYRINQTAFRLSGVSSDTKTLDIKAILTDPYGTVKINGVLSDIYTVDLLPGENVITVEIISEDKTNSKTYQILVNQLLEDVDTLESLTMITNKGEYLLGDALNNPIITFNPTTNTYQFTVNEDVEHINFDMVLGSSKQTVTGPFSEPVNILHGKQTFDIVVTPEDTTKPSRTYKIEVTKVNDAIGMNQLLANGKDIYEEGIFTYTLDSVTNDIKTIKVIPLFDNFATYDIYDHQNKLVNGNDVVLSFGINLITVKVVSESGNHTEIYTITIEQTYSNDNEIIDVRFFDASTNVNRLNYDPEITTYNIEFPATTNIARLRVETHNKALVFINGVQEINTRKDFTLVSGQTITVKFHVVAEDGTKGIEYTVNVYKRKTTDPVLSDNTNLLDVTIEIPMDQVKFNFDPTIYEYVITIPYKYNELYIKAHTESLGATVANEGAYALNPGEPKVIRLRVTAEDGTVAEREYKFTIKREEPLFDTTLKSLVIEDLNGNKIPFDQAVFNPENRTYNITLPESVRINKVNVVAIKQHDSQKLYNTGIVDLHGEIEGYYNTIITVTVVAEDGSVGEYIVYILHDLDFASIAEVKDISIIGDNGISYFGLEFKNNVYVYDDIVVPFTVNSTRLIVQTIGNIIYLDKNNQEIEDNRLQTFDQLNQITYRFKIESTNGQNISEIYTIKVSREQPDTNSLLEHLEINGEAIKGFSPNIYKYTYIHPLQFENYIELYGIAQSENSTVKGNDIYTLIEGQTRIIHIEVKAESGDITIYEIHISYVNSNALLGQLTVYEMIGDQEIENAIPLKDDTLAYVIIIGRDTRFVNIKGFAKDQGGASIRGFGIQEVGLLDAHVDITVTSGDGLEEITYLLTLRRDTSLSSLKEITLLQINDSDVVRSDEDDPFVYRYNINNGTNVVKLSAITNNSSRVSINGSEFGSTNMGEIVMTDVNESQVVRVSVKAEDGSIQHYMIVLQKEQQSSMLLTVLLILSIILWIVTTMFYILKRVRRNNKKDKNQLIF